MSEATGVGKRIRRLKREDGQALVELAFVLPLILLFLFAIIDFGLALNAQNSDTNLANLAARQLSVAGTSTETCNGTSQTTLLLWVDCIAKQNGETQPQYACLRDETTDSSYVAGDAVKIQVQAPFNWFGVIGASGGVMGGATSTIGASATMRIESAMISGTTTSTYITNGPKCST